MNSFATINRSMIAVYFKEAFLNTLKPHLSIEDASDLSLEDLNADPLMLMVPPMSDESSEQDLMAFREQITQVAFELYLPDDVAVPALNLSFDDYFETDFFEDIYDLAVDYELSYEEENEEEDGEDFEMQEAPASNDLLM